MNRVRVGDVAEQVRGVTFAKKDSTKERLPGYTAVLTASNITERGLRLSPLQYVPTGMVRSSQKLKNGDILVTASSGSLDVVGRAVLVDGDLDAGFGAFCKVLRFNDQVDPRYAAHYFRTTEYRSTVSRLAAGANINNLRNEDLDGIEIPLPPVPEQRRIASMLDRAEEVTRLRERSKDLSRELESRLFARFFQDELAAAAQTATIPLGEIAICSSGITKGRRTTDQTLPTPYLAVSNVQDRRLDLSVVKTIDATEAERNRFRLASGDLLLTEGGDPDKLGRGTVWRAEIEGAIHQNHIFRVRITNENFLPDYLNWLLASDYGKSYFLSRAKQTTGIATINQTQLKAFPVLAVKPERQRAFVRVLEKVRISAGAADRHAATLHDLMVGLQSRAFRGEL